MGRPAAGWQPPDKPTDGPVYREFSPDTSSRFGTELPKHRCYICFYALCPAAASEDVADRGVKCNEESLPKSFGWKRRSW